MKIIYLYNQNPEEKRHWSGTINSIYENLKKRYEVEWVGIEHFEIYRLFFAAFAYLKNIIYGKKHLYGHSELYGKFFARLYSKKLKKKNYDIILAPNISAIVPYIETEKDIISLDDGVFDDLVDYYEYFSCVSERSLTEAKNITLNYYKKSSAIILSSSWAAVSANEKYGEFTDVYMMRFGANFSNIIYADYKNYKKTDVVRMLFIGVNWINKGGPILIEAFEYIKKKGFKVSLTVIGCNPSIEEEGITVIPFLDKSKQKDIETFFEKYINSDFFVLPTRFECAGIVFCEASAFGLPILAANTGGVQSYVEDGVNGYCLPCDADGKEYAEKMLSLFSDEDKYYSLRKTTREKYERELNWDHWLDNFEIVVENVLNKKHKI